MPSQKCVQQAFSFVFLINIVFFFLNLVFSSSSQTLRPNSSFTAALNIDKSFPNLISRNEAPVIGILTQGTTDMLYYDNYTMIAASYIRYIESSGGRVVAIPYYLNKTDFERIYQNINGLLIPGGRMKLVFPRNKTEDNDSEFKWSIFAKAAKYFIDRTIEDYEKGIYFPILGVCLGQEAIALALHKDLTNTLTVLNLTDNTYIEGAGPVFNTVRKSYKSRLFKSFNEEELDALAGEAKFFYHHKNGISLNTYQDSKALSQHMIPLTVLRDNNGIDYITSYEMIDYPFFGVQFHPEKTSFEWNITTDRSPEAISITHKIGANFVAECRKNSHTVIDPCLVSNLTVYNHQVMGPKHNYDQLFYFSKEKIVDILNFDNTTSLTDRTQEDLSQTASLDYLGTQSGTSQFFN